MLHIQSVKLFRNKDTRFSNDDAAADWQHGRTNDEMAERTNFPFVLLYYASESSRL